MTARDWFFATTGADAPGAQHQWKSVLVIVFPENTRGFPEIITSTGAKFWLRFCLSILVLVILQPPRQPGTWEDSTLFLCPEIGQFSPHFGAISLRRHTENLEKKDQNPLEKIQKNSSGDGAPKLQISVPCCGRTRPSKGIFYLVWKQAVVSNKGPSSQLNVASMRMVSHATESPYFTCKWHHSLAGFIHCLFVCLWTSWTIYLFTRLLFLLKWHLFVWPLDFSLVCCEIICQLLCLFICMS